MVALAFPFLPLRFLAAVTNYYKRNTHRSHPCSLFFFNGPAPTEIYTLSLHDALPISLDHRLRLEIQDALRRPDQRRGRRRRSEEHTSELQSRFDLVCRLLLEKKKKTHRPLCYMIYQDTRTKE